MAPGPASGLATLATWEAGGLRGLAVGCRGGARRCPGVGAGAGEHDPAECAPTTRVTIPVSGLNLARDCARGRVASAVRRPILGLRRYFPGFEECLAVALGSLDVFDVGAVFSGEVDGLLPNAVAPTR